MTTMTADSPKTENRKQKTENVHPKALVLYGYGLNCDYETAYALAQAGADAVRVHTTDLLENPGLLWDYHLLAIPGGFSWGDEHGAGVILALRLKLALGSALAEFIAAGRLVIGICNGFQVLVNLGLLPGLPGRPEARLAALIPNDCGNFRDAWIHLKAIPSACIFTQGLDLFELPIRHGEGKFYADGPVLAELADRGQIALKYAAPSGRAAMGQFPYNPNGSLMDIAGICDATGRVLGLMPHPEAHISSFQHPTWTRDKESFRRRGEPYPGRVSPGLAIFDNAVRYLQTLG
jgi:phosphoribosylformylglycinamidine synthase subunit PurQ / glutaminase